MATATPIPEQASTRLTTARHDAPRAAARYLRFGLRIGLGASIAWQAMFAGQFLSGQPAALSLHEVGAYAVVLFAVATLIVELVFGWRQHRWVTAWLAGLLATAIVAQLLLGFMSAGKARFLAYHVPLGVFIAGLYIYYVTARRGPSADVTQK